MLFWRSKKIKQIDTTSQTDLSGVWLQGFQSGFSKAWEVMTPYIHQSIDEAKKVLFDRAYEKAIEGLRPAVETKIDSLQKYNLRDIQSILDKKDELKDKLSRLKNEQDKLKVLNYIEALDWMINGDLLQKA